MVDIDKKLKKLFEEWEKQDEETRRLEKTVCPRCRVRKGLSIIPPPNCPGTCKP